MKFALAATLAASAFASDWWNDIQFANCDLPFDFENPPHDPKELEKLEKMTLGEALKKGLPLCSRCPGSTTEGSKKKDKNRFLR